MTLSYILLLTYLQSVHVQRLSHCTDAVTNWHLFNGLLLNPTKTEALVTGTRQQVARLDCTAVKFADTTVSISSAVRVLGVTLDSHLTFDKHISLLNCLAHATTTVEACAIFGKLSIEIQP